MSIDISSPTIHICPMSTTTGGGGGGGIAGPPPAPPPAPPQPPRHGFFDDWTPGNYLTALGFAWAIIVGLLIAVYTQVNGKVDSLDTRVTQSLAGLQSQVAALNQQFNGVAVSASSVHTLLTESPDLKKTISDTHDALIGTVLPTLKQHSESLAAIQTSIGSIASGMASLQSGQQQLQRQFEAMREALTPNAARPEER